MSRRRFITRPVALITILAMGTVFLGVGAFAWHPWTRHLAGVQVAPGVIVVMPKGYDQTKWKLSATRPTPRAVGSYRSTKLIPLVPVRDYHASRPIPRGTKLVFTVKKGLTSPVFEAFFDPRTNMWIPEPTTYNLSTGVATATVAHFSIHGLFTWPTEYLKAIFQGALKNLLGDVAIGRRPPVCGNPNGVRMYYTGGMSSVLPCHDATIVQAPSLGSPGTAEITVKLVNNRNYPIDVSYPRTAQATASDPGSVAAQVGAAITKIANAPLGQKLILVPGGATATITLPRAQPPFRNLKIWADFDGEAYLVSILGTALDELSLMTRVKLATLTRNLLDGWSGGQALYRIQSQLTVTDFSPAEVKTIADVGMDAILAAFQDNSGAILTSAIKVAIALVNELIQSIIGLVDNLTGQADHTYTFAPYGTTWNVVTDLHSVDWASITIPGHWFKGPDQVTLSNGEATGVQTGILFLGRPEVETVYGNTNQVAYGALPNGLQVAALNVIVNAGGTADSVRAEGWVLFKAGPTGPEAVGEVTPQSGWPNAWSPNPQQSGNVSYITKLVFAGGGIVADETYYHTNDYTADPTGRARTTWTYTGTALVPHSTQILR